MGTLLQLGHYLVKILVQRHYVCPPRAIERLLHRSLGLFQISYLLSLFFCYLICYTTLIRVSGTKLHKAALGTLINAPLKYFCTTDTGHILNLFSQDMTVIDNELPTAVTDLSLDICNAIGMAAAIASSSPFLVISYLFIFIVLYGIQKFYLRTSRQLRLLDLEAKSPL